MRKTEELADGTEVLGLPVKEWNNAFIGNFQESLAEVKQRVAKIRGEVLSDSQSSAIDNGK